MPLLQSLSCDHAAGNQQTCKYQKPVSPLRSVGRAMISPIELAGFLSPDECQRVISEAVVGDCTTGAMLDGKKKFATRRANIYWLDEASASTWIFDRMLQAVVECNRRHFSFEIEEFAERMQVSHYPAKKMASSTGISTLAMGD